MQIVNFFTYFLVTTLTFTLFQDKKIGETVSATVYNVDSLGNVHFYLGDDKSKPDFITAKSMPQNFEKYESDSKYLLMFTYFCF